MLTFIGDFAVNEWFMFNGNMRLIWGVPFVLFLWGIPQDSWFIWKIHENPMENPNPKWMMNKGTPWRRKPPVMPGDPPSHHWISQNRATGPLGSFSAQPCWLMRWKLGASSPGIAGHWSLELLDGFHITKRKSQWSSNETKWIPTWSFRFDGFLWKSSNISIPNG